jgi:hypothetical protein
MGRWTIFGMFGLIVMIGVPLAAIHDPSPVWATCLTLLVGAVFVLVLEIRIIRKIHQAFWIVFAALGSAYLALAIFGEGDIGPPMVTRLIDQASSSLEPSPPVVLDLWRDHERWSNLSSEERQARAEVLTQDSSRVRWYASHMRTRKSSFRMIVHSLLSLVFGIVGAGLVQPMVWLIRRPVAKSDVSCP